MAETTPRVAVHVADGEPGRQELVLRNVANLARDLGEGAVIEVVALGPGLSVCLAGGELAGEVAGLIERGVGVRACANTLRAMGIGEDRLLPGVEVVPAGVGHLVRRQLEGWAYLRP